ncbi:CusA/CzcA family heavy metal efflux RND transporter [Echinicola jeungdonensis]|uniref:CusA/CzcA family heavy metal efflux RND transporter n=1 Tax=Echinicola jeungdonensis TaxID=709343 RepID=A0ABV5J519_9BACT|nr:CusA/CzcA family heavy metal efflux RND transporter [Echinicola jeungdonensis]MDN3670696.1 CusA/CzcA family heavy metal efflux RND transporter [Echinicola jeungdonensis]
MINKLIDFSIKNKLFIGLLTLALVGAGIWSMKEVPIDAVPDITNNQVQVITQAPNLGTEDIEQFVTYPVEVSMANLPGVVEIRSVSRFGLSVVTIVFEDDMGTYLPRQLVAEKLTEVKEEIPKGFGQPSMGPISTGLGEIYQYTLKVDPKFSGEYSVTDLRTVQDWIIKRQMAMVPGVVEVNAFGGKIKQYEVAVSPDELKAIGITITDIFRALEENNQNTGGAYIERNHHANFIRGEGMARSLEEIRNIAIKTEGGLPIRIKDVADVRFGNAVRYGAFTKDGQGEAVGGMVLMLKGANSDEVIESVKTRIAEIQKSLPEGVRIEPFLDRSKLVADTTGTITNNLVEGGLIVIFVLVVLLGNWRGGLIVASTIPLSLLFAFVLMNVFDVWANLMSLGAIDFGIIVDGAVIIVESTVFFLYQKKISQNEIDQSTRDKVTADASKKMMNSAFFGQLIILIVFLPILALEGVEGKMFKPMALTFSFAMIGAMLLCLTYVPMMSSLFIRVNKNDKLSWGDRAVLWLEEKYEPLLRASLKKGKLLIGLSVVLFGMAVFIFTRMGGEFIPQLDEGDIAFHIILKPGSSLSESVETSSKIEQLILDNFPEVEHAMTRFGVADVPTDPMPMDIGDCFLILKPKDQWESADSKEGLIEKIKSTINVVPGVNYEFTQPIEMRFNELLTGVREDIAVKLFGEDLDVLAQKSREMGRIISTVEGVADMRVEATTGLPQMTVLYQRDKLAQYDLNVEDLNTVVQTAFAGKKAGAIFEGEKRFDLVVRLDSLYRTQISDVRNLYVNTPDGAQIPLKEVANISYQPGPMQISRDNTNRRTYVGINVRGRDIESLVKEIQQKLDAQLELPPGYYIRYGGAFENLERATNRLELVVPIALALIFILIYFALRSIRQTLMIYMAIPLAAIGGVFSLWIRGMPFSISAGVGFIVLFGVAVLNGLVLINGLNDLKSDGMSNLDERIRKGTRRRIRPILLTALTDILGFLPMAISTTSGAEVQRPLATVVIGGLMTSTLLTLFILPILYNWMESKKLSLNKNLLVLAILFMGLPAFAMAQEKPITKPITLEQAISKAVDRYPLIKSKKLEIEKQEALKKTAWELGRTQVFTSGEEISEGQGVYTTIGVQQQQIDVLGIGAKTKAQNQRVALAEAALDLSERELIREVSMAFSKVYVKHKQLLWWQKMDTLFQEFSKAAKLRYETEATSKLEWLASRNQVQKVTIKLEQAKRDYQMVLQRFNLWWENDTVFTANAQDLRTLIQLESQYQGQLNRHPLLQFAKRKMDLAQSEVKVANKDFLPTISAQYGIQEIGGQSGFSSFQLGLNIPLAFGPQQGRLQAAKVNERQTQEDFKLSQLKFRTTVQNLQEQFQKWKSSWEFFQKDALPLAREQENGAVTAYKSGAIDYVTFIQLIRDAMEVELDSWEALDQFLQTKFQLEFYLEPTKQ